MSATVPPTPPAAPTPEPIWTAQTILAVYGMTIAGMILGAILYKSDPQMNSQALVGAFGIISVITGFFFGSSKGSQDKDKAKAEQEAAPGTKTVSVIPAAPVVLAPIVAPAAAAAANTDALAQNTAATRENTEATTQAPKP